METNKVIKRDGSEVDFDGRKITNAIILAMKASGLIDKSIAKSIAKNAEDLLEDSYPKAVTVSEIEDFVYFSLIDDGCEHAAKAYEGYRKVQEYKRENNSTDSSILELIAKKNIEVMNENSNKNAMLNSTQRDLIAGEVSKDIARRKLIPAHIVQAHDDGVLHWHDMDYTISSMFNCCLVNLEDMLTNNTVINEKLVESPKSFVTACTVATQIMAQISSNQFGGQSITIAHLAPFLRKTYDREYRYFMEKYNNEELAKEEAHSRMIKELAAGVQTIRYQLSTLMTTNGR